MHSALLVPIMLTCQSHAESYAKRYLGYPLVILDNWPLYRTVRANRIKGQSPNPCKNTPLANHKEPKTLWVKRSTPPTHSKNSSCYVKTRRLSGIISKWQESRITLVMPTNTTFDCKTIKVRHQLWLWLYKVKFIVASLAASSVSFRRRVTRHIIGIGGASSFIWHIATIVKYLIVWSRYVGMHYGHVAAWWCCKQHTGYKLAQLPPPPGALGLNRLKGHFTHSH